MLFHYFSFEFLNSYTFGIFIAKKKKKKNLEDYEDIIM